MIFDFLNKPEYYRLEVKRELIANATTLVRYIVVKYRYIPFTIAIDTSLNSKNFFRQLFRTKTTWAVQHYSDAKVSGFARSWFKTEPNSKAAPRWSKF